MIYYVELKNSEGVVYSVKFQKSFQKELKNIKKCKKDYEPWYACLF